MTTKYYTFEGTCQWAKVRKPDPEYDNFSIELDLDSGEDNWETFKESGLKLEPKEKDDGHWVKFRRPMKKMIKDELVTFGPPEVLNPDGSEFEGLIGNGSRVKIEVCVYPAGKYVGHRLNRIKVIDLVEYNPPSDNDVPDAPSRGKRSF